MERTPATFTADVAASQSRLPWIDHLRTFVILLVVNVHACVTYGHVGSWYVTEGQEPSFAHRVPFIVWETTLQSFFMGLLFFFAGYFAFSSMGRRGPAAFARERLFRLGLPTLFYMLVIHPFILLGLNPWHHPFGSWRPWYLKFVLAGHWLSASGPMWFTFALLAFSLVWAGWRVVRPSFRSSALVVPPISGRGVVTFAVLLAASGFLLRLNWPLGTSVLNMQLCYFSQYMGAFIVGLAAARDGWLLPLARSSLAQRAGWFALIVGPLSLLLICLLILRGGLGGETPFHGGLHWQAIVLALWEQLTGIGLSLGLMALFLTKLNRETPALRWLSDRSFGVYLFHTPVLIALTLLFRRLAWNPIASTLLLTVAGLIISFIVADLARRLPLLRQMV